MSPGIFEGIRYPFDLVPLVRFGDRLRAERPHRFSREEAS